MVNLTLGNNLQWNPNRNSYIFIQENAFENVVCEMASILSRLDVLTFQDVTLLEHDTGRAWYRRSLFNNQYIFSL